MTTANSAADIKALIDRMDLKHVILYGDSYGTYLGQSFAARYGNQLQALILSSAYPGNNGFWPTLYPAAINAVDLACDRAKNCSGNAVGRYKRVIRQLGTGSRKSKNILEYLMGAGSYSPNSYRNLNLAISQFLDGDRAPLFELTAPYGPDQGSPSYFSAGMYQAVICNDYPGRGTRTRASVNARSSLRPRSRRSARTTSSRPSPSGNGCTARPATSPTASPGRSTDSTEPPIPPERRCRRT